MKRPATLCILLLCFALPLRAVELKLKSACASDGEYLTLNDLFDVVGDAGNPRVMKRPERVTVYTVSDLLPYLDDSLKGIPFTLLGSSIEVTPVTVTITEQTLAEKIRGAYRPSVTGGGIGLSTEGTPNAIEDPNIRYEVRFLYAVPEIALNHGNYRLELVFEDPGKIGVQKIRVNIIDANMRRAESFVVTTDIFPMRRVLVAKEFIKKKTALADDMFETKEFRADRIPSDSVFNAQETRDAVSKMHIAKGNIVRRIHLNDDVAVRKGDTVRVAYKKNAISVEIDAIAIEAASEGDSVRVKNAKTGKEFVAHVRQGAVVYSK